MLRLAPFLLLPLLAGCVTATPYQPMQNGYGYSDQQIEERRFRVRFSGNDVTERERVEDYLLYRAAELTLSQGGTHFLLTDTSTDAETTYTQTVDTGFGFGRFSRFGVGFGLGVGTARPSSSRYEAQAFVVVLDEAADAQQGDLRAFDAREVQEYLDERIERPD